MFATRQFPVHSNLKKQNIFVTLEQIFWNKIIRFKKLFVHIDAISLTYIGSIYIYTCAERLQISTDD